MSADTTSLLLINPPVTKACEPPGGIARLAGALRANGVSVDVLDLSIEGLMHLLDLPLEATGVRDTQALRRRQKNCTALHQSETYQSPGRYIRAVHELGRALELAGERFDAAVGLANFRQDGLQPVRSADLLRAAQEPERNPFFGHFSRRLTELIDKRPPRAVGISIMYLNQAMTAFAIAGFLRRRYPDLPLIAGGGLVTSWMSRPGWQNPWSGLWDRMVSGPGEGALLELMGVEATDHAPATPSFEGLPVGDYLSPGLVLPYSAASGCWWGRCAFCPERAERNPYHPVHPAEAAGQIRALSAAHRPALIHLLDNAVSPALLGELIAEPPGAPWYGFVRVREELADPEYCRALRRSGCAMLKLGLESGHQGVLDAMGKGITVEAASRALRALHEADIETYVYLMFGTPWEGPEEARATLEFTVRHAEAIGFLNLSIFNMPMGMPETALYETGEFYEGDLTLYAQYRHPGGWDRGEVRRFLEGEFKRHPAVAPILRRTPPVFTSNHAPFMPRAEGSST